MKDRILSVLKNADGYVSGEDLSKNLGITRSAVWKHISQLKDEGYIINSVRNRGYKLENVFDMIDEKKLSFNAETLGMKIILLKSTDSTNNELKRLARINEESGTVVCAYSPIHRRQARADLADSGSRTAGDCIFLLFSARIYRQVI